MVHVLNIILTILTAVLLLPAIVFCLQCCAALLPARRAKRPAEARRPRVAIVMPAHNEQGGIGSAINSVLPQLVEGDRLLVVADNCTDATAETARACGAELIERNDSEHRGKGYALDFGLRHLADDAPQAVIIMDSDCIAAAGMVDALVKQVAGTNRPAQAVYLMSSPSRPQPRDAVSALAFTVKNLVRPRGLARLGLPCLLTGTGMAFPWPIIRDARLASGNIVEDLQLSVDLALAGHPPLLCPQASVMGSLPNQGRAARAQRTRWEHGFLSTALSWVPRLLLKGILRINKNLLSVALDLSVPPLALLVVTMTLALLASGAAAFAGTSWRLPAMLAGGLFAVGACVVMSWARFARHRLPASALLAAPLYAVAKIPIYLKFAIRPETRWIRTDRGGDDPSNEPPGAPRLPTILLHGVRFHSIRETECVDHVMSELGQGRGGMLVTPNLDHLNRAQVDSSYARLVAEADIVVADGMPLVWASRLQRTPLPERVAGSDLISSLSQAASDYGRSVFLLGGAPGSAEKAAEVLREQYPKLSVQGCFCPAMGFDTNPEAVMEIIDRLNAAKPQIVYVGLGSPKQEKLIHELREWLPQSWWLGVGYSFSFLAGDGRRAPMWMRRAGLEWFHRLACEPRRLARRYLVEGLPFGLRLLSRSVACGLIGSARQEVAARPSIRPLQAAKPARAAAPPPIPQAVSLVHQSFTEGFMAQWLRSPRSGFPPRGSTMFNSRHHKTLRAFVLLGGSLRPTPFRAAINRSILDMPIERGKRLLRYWQQLGIDLARAEEMDKLPIRVLVDRDSHLPAAAPTRGACSVSIERDAAEYRGTGGVLHDLAEEYDDDDFLLVANGAQILTFSLAEMVDQLYQTEADISFVAHEDGTPSGLMLVRCGALRMISPKGYVDMKEQALPAIARRFKVTHIDHRRPTGLLLRSYQDYLAAVRWRHHARLIEATSGEELLAADYPRRPERLPGFVIVEEGAVVDPTACLHDCVVLRGARVGPRALVARSVLCAGAVLGPDETAVDQLLSGSPSAAPGKRHILQTA